MAFENEIKQAQKIADAWLKRSQDDEAFFIGLKKENVSWEKSYVKSIEAEINAGQHDHALSMIRDTSRPQLKEFEEACEARYDKHAAFVRGAPRKGSAGIADELKLKAGTDAYKAVCTAMDKVLIAHTKQFKATEQAWINDLKVRLDLLRSKLDTLEKIATGGKGKVSAYAEQLMKDIETYKTQIERAIVALKPSMAETAIKSIVADPKAWCSGAEKVQLDQYKIFSDRLAAIDGIKTLSDKNYNRVLKSLPPEVAKQKFILAKQFKQLDQIHDQAASDAEAARRSFKMAVEVIKKVYPKLV